MENGPPPFGCSFDGQPLGRRLYLTHRAVHDVLDGRLARHGASIPNWVLLREAIAAGEVKQRELAARMSIEPSTLVRHLDRLTEDGLIERRPDPDDRRAVRVVVTETGRRKLGELNAVAVEFDTELRSLFSERELGQLRKALGRIHDHFTEIAEVEENAHAD